MPLLQLLNELSRYPKIRYVSIQRATDSLRLARTVSAAANFSS
jgi:hypothetical protein